MHEKKSIVTKFIDEVYQSTDLDAAKSIALKAIQGSKINSNSKRVMTLKVH